MNKSIGRLSYLCMAAAVFICCIAADSAVVRAQDKTDESVQVLVLRSKPFGITPDTVTVKKGTTLVWYNKDPEPVTVAFLQPMGPSCGAPVNFYSSLDGTFQTGLIPQTGTASMCIVIPGTYEFEVWRLVSKPDKPTKEITRGKIIVQ